MQPTPLRVHKIGAFLKAGIGSTSFPLYSGGAADGQSVGRVLCAKPSRSRMALSVFLAQERHAATKERIERGMMARCATGFRLAVSQPYVVRAPVVLTWFPPTFWAIQCGTSARDAERDSVRHFLNPVWCERSLCWRGSGQRGSAERSCSCRFNAGGSCLNSSIYQSSRPTRACSGRRFASSEIVRFSALVSATMELPSIGGGAAKAQPVGRSLINGVLD